MPRTHLDLNNTEIAFRRMSNRDLRKTIWMFRAMANPLLARIGPAAVTSAFSLKIPINPLVRHTLFNLFCGGESITGASDRAEELAKFGVATVLDYAVEGAHDEASIAKTIAEIKDVIAKVEITPHLKFAVFKPTALANIDVLAKISADEGLSSDETLHFEQFKNSVFDLCESAATKNVQIMIDAEETWIQKATDDVVYEAMKNFNQSRTIVFNTYQTYLKAGLDRIKTAHELARKDGFRVGAKIVRGAYMEKERERADRLGYASPINISKDHTDNEFDKTTHYCLKHIENFSICIATHNASSIEKATREMNTLGLAKDDTRISFAQLFGMSDNLTFNLGHQGYNAMKYVPYGPIAEVLPYLMRRAQENSSISGQMSRERYLLEKELERRRS